MSDGNGTIKVDHGIPIPKLQTKRAKYPFRDMKIGDSFFVDDATVRSGFYTAAKLAGIKVTVRGDGEGLRVWRIG